MRLHIFFILLFFCFLACNANEKLDTVSISINKHIFIVEVARTQGQREKGLMFRKGLKEHEGMLFVFPEDRFLGFYMKNTYIPLSIAYILNSGEIAQIEDLEPLDETTVYSRQKARYALEVSRGVFEKYGIQVGDTVKLPAGFP
jgi:uncharacterized membrane protein (UPF0127 family)